MSLNNNPIKNQVNSSDCSFCHEISSSGFKSKSNSLSNTNYGLLAASLFGVASVSLVLITIPFLTPALRRICLPYVPATDTQTKNIVTALGYIKPRRVIDLGSGDGRVVFAAARHPGVVSATGVELNPWLVLYSKISSFTKGLYKQTVFNRKDLFKVDYNKYDTVIVFGVDTLMPELETKLVGYKVPINVIACRFPLTNQRPVRTVGEGVDTVWLYKLNHNHHGIQVRNQ